MTLVYILKRLQWIRFPFVFSANTTNFESSNFVEYYIPCITYSLFVFHSEFGQLSCVFCHVHSKWCETPVFRCRHVTYRVTDSDTSTYISLTYIQCHHSTWIYIYICVYVYTFYLYIIPAYCAFVFGSRPAHAVIAYILPSFYYSDTSTYITMYSPHVSDAFFRGFPKRARESNFSPAKFRTRCIPCTTHIEPLYIQ